MKKVITESELKQIIRKELLREFDTFEHLDTLKDGETDNWSVGDCLNVLKKHILFLSEMFERSEGMSNAAGKPLPVRNALNNIDIMEKTLSALKDKINNEYFESGEYEDD